MGFPGGRPPRYLSPGEGAPVDTPNHNIKNIGYPGGDVAQLAKKNRTVNGYMTKKITVDYCMILEEHSQNIISTVERSWRDSIEMQNNDRVGRLKHGRVWISPLDGHKHSLVIQKKIPIWLEFKFWSLPAGLTPWSSKACLRSTMVSKLD